ncbi:ATP-dependent DNA helicase RecQ [Cytophagaceae bacterium YF14B1]|uniref:ATP-dependent DNA helicase RecQ n=1 Tax=Xanthocytophaga flava TaxID=3048013 RepID=A0AAE3QVE9_9BACT|nr:ATP-dependent DNA helicase RecQ [Xanthocytophaga flavus]MDJ1484235.1 ATP-dependent DNA helicase RecQ [Xanthocytophaga flavus]
MAIIHDILKQYWGYDAFRPLQEPIIQSVLNKKDTLALLPTGGGKSICFQVPAMAMEGVCIVISPLIALMKDQVENLKKRGIDAAAIYSGMTRRMIDITLDNCRFGSVKFLYVSPERIRTEIFIERFRQMKVCMIAVDEAHCISQWGYDFRPPYLQIAKLRELVPAVPIIALTATATEEVRKDIIEKLVLRESSIFAGSFARENLSYSVFSLEDKERKMVDILQKVPGSSVVYVRSRKRTQDLANWLNRQGIKADYYHAGLTNEERAAKQDNWIKNRTRVMVATNAFGMGIDKPDVRTVIHIDIPANLESYYQEAGRAGRDGKKAYAVALYNEVDLEHMKTALEQNYPSIDMLRQVYQAMANYFQVAAGGGYLASYDFDFEDFCKTYQLPAQETFYAIKRLEEEGFVQLTEAFNNPSKILFTIDKKGLYEFQVANSMYDPLIKTILRMYGGDIFNNFTMISEKKLADYLQTDPATIERLLLYLHQSNVLIYEKQKNKPQLIFTTVRHEAARLPLDVKQLTWRKNRDEEKLQAVIRYVSENRRCRTLQLLEYFGEYIETECGVCDVCSQKRKSEKPAKTQQYRVQIQQLLNSNAMPVSELIRSLVVANESEVLEVLREMIEMNEIQLMDNNYIKKV